MKDSSVYMLMTAIYAAPTMPIWLSAIMVIVLAVVSLICAYAERKA